MTLTLRDYMTYWYTTYRMPNQQPNTQATSKSILKNHVFVSSIADKDLRDVTVRDCQEFLTHELLYGSKRRFTKGCMQEYALLSKDCASLFDYFRLLAQIAIVICVIEINAIINKIIIAYNIKSPPFKRF